MKKLFFAGCLILGVSFGASAQFFQPEERAKELKAQLKLNDVQTEKITGYYRTLRTQIDSLDKIESSTKDDFQKVMAVAKAKIKAVLTKEQDVAYEKWLEDNGKNRKSSQASPTPTEQH